jgi:hypothetical protein
MDNSLLQSEHSAHCSLPSCNTLDFLPLSCPHCTLKFCRDHSNPSNHQCPKDPNSSSNNSIISQTERFDQKFKDLLPDRDRVEKERERLDREKFGKNEMRKKAIELLKSRFSKLRSSSSSTLTDSTGISFFKKKSSKSTRIILLRQKGKSGDPKKLDKDFEMKDRVYLKCYWMGEVDMNMLSEIESTKGGETEKIFWFVNVSR